MWRTACGSKFQPYYKQFVINWVTLNVWVTDTVYPIPRNKPNFCLVIHLTFFFCITADQFAMIINFDVGKLMVDRDRHWELPYYCLWRVSTVGSLTSPTPSTNSVPETKPMAQCPCQRMQSSELKRNSLCAFNLSNLLYHWYGGEYMYMYQASP